MLRWEWPAANDPGDSTDPDRRSARDKNLAGNGVARIPHASRVFEPVTQLRVAALVPKARQDDSEGMAHEARRTGTGGRIGGSRGRGRDWSGGCRRGRRPEPEAHRRRRGEAPEHRLRPHRRPVVEPRRATCRTCASCSARARPSRNYFVTDSLCCPSRASIFTGAIPHNTRRLHQHRRRRRLRDLPRPRPRADTFATALQAAGYRTAMMGKYLNGYQPAARGYVPPGWTDWDVAGQRLPRSSTTCCNAERPDRRTTAAAGGLPDRRPARRRATAFVNRVGGRRQAVPAGDRDVRAARARTRRRRATRARFPGLQAPRDAGVQRRPT